MKTENTRREITELILASAPDVGVRGLHARAFHDSDHGELVEWIADLFDPYAPEGEDTIGSVVVPDWYPEPSITWI